MKLKSIEIFNFRSIEHLSIEIKPIKDSRTYCLFGINESGKSSILRGLSLLDNEEVVYPKDYYDETKPVRTVFHYEVDANTTSVTKNALQKDLKWPKDVAEKVKPTEVSIIVEYSPDQNTTRSLSEKINFVNKTLHGYKLVENIPFKKSKDDTEEEINLPDYFSKNLVDQFYECSHKVVFWESSDKYFLLDEIDLAEFSTNPKETSIPLTNSFLLCGITENNLASTISKLIDNASISNLASKLSDAVTKHINTVWQNHPVTLKFLINNNKVSLLVEDDEVKYKAKTPLQRSDGFRQFISFLLSISAENSSDVLQKTLMLIDEPETHLHPQAQINLRNELINITKNDKNNIAFYATHSNYLVDKSNLKRNIKVVKKDNEKTELEFVKEETSTYAEVNYSVFGIPTTDYHNELYGYLEDVHPTKINKLPKDKGWKNLKTGNTEKVCLSKYIRNSIHHPENTSNRKFKESSLKKSIEILRELKYGKTTK